MTKIVLWVSDLDAQTAFYCALLGIEVGVRSDGFVELNSKDNSVLLHELPIEYRAALPLVAQLAAQTDVAIKPVFQVADVEAARKLVAGSLATFADIVVTYGNSTYLDVVDPEGNVIQIEQKFQVGNQLAKQLRESLINQEGRPNQRLEEAQDTIPEAVGV